jgi:hypothetical protein
MEKFPPAVLRALDGLSEGRGRTVVIAGPPFSGKSALLESIRTEANARGFSRVDLTGSYRHRTKPFEALASLEVTRAQRPGTGGGKAKLDAGNWMYVPGPPFAIPGIEGPRASGTPRPASRTGGEMAVGGGTGRILSVTELHATLLRCFREEPAVPIAVLVEDATLLDPESRDSVLHLRPRARYRPILVVIVLDVTLPAFQPWEERLAGRAEVDWVRFRHAKPDAREASRLQEKLETLPEETRWLLLLLTLLGGSVPELTLARVTRLGVTDLPSTLEPAVASNLVKLHEGKVTIPHDAWIDIIPGIVPEEQLRRAHLEVAEALAAMSAEPDLKRRMELTHHYYEAARDPLSLRYLLETADICDQLQAFDAAEGLLARALTCVGSLPPKAQAEATAEVRLLHARALAFAGRVNEAEEELHEGFSLALTSGAETERLAEWAEMLLPALRMLGPRPSLLAIVRELAERCAEADAVGAEVVFDLLIAENGYERGDYSEALREANHAAERARGLEPLIAQSAARLAAAMFVARGGYSVEAEEELFLLAQADPGRARRSPLAQIVEEVQLRLVERRRDPTEAIASHQRAIAVSQHLRALVNELYHTLDIAEIELDHTPTTRTRDTADRAVEIVELLHLIPPSPAWARSWLVQGRFAALEGRMDEARDIWGAVADRPQPVAIARYRAESILRLTLLELAEGRPEAARPLLDRLDSLLPRSGLPEEWATSMADLRRAAKESRHGSGRLPPRAPEPSPAAGAAAPDTAPTAP